MFQALAYNTEPRVSRLIPAPRDRVRDYLGTPFGVLMNEVCTCHLLIYWEYVSGAPQPLVGFVASECLAF